MGWTATLDEGDDEIVIDSNARFDLAVAKEPVEGGVESVEWKIGIEGKVVDASPETIADLIATYAGAVSDNHDAIRVRLALDGEDKFDLDPAVGFIGPYIKDFAVTSEPGDGYSKWGFAFTIIFKAKGLVDGTQPTDVYEFHTSLATTEKNGVVVRKVWKATAKSSSSSSAMTAVRSFKPSDKYITHEREEMFRDSEASAVWVWEATVLDGVTRWECHVTYQGFGQGYAVDTQVGVAVPAVLHMRQQGAGTIEVRGRIVAFRADIKPPSPHFEESETLVRQHDQERFAEEGARLLDRQRQEYELAYHEVYLCTDAVPPQPIHENDHHLADPGQAPGNGGIAQ